MTNGVAGAIFFKNKSRIKDFIVEQNNNEKCIISQETTDDKPEEITCEFNGKTYKAIKIRDKIIITDK